jgi:hypothetical protein
VEHAYGHAPVFPFAREIPPMTSEIQQRLVGFASAVFKELGIRAREVVVIDDDGKKSLRVRVPYLVAEPPVTPQAFVPNAIQADILTVLDGAALRTDALAAKIGCERSQLFKKPGGIQELKEHGLVASHPRLGYYRSDAPPQELASSPESQVSQRPPREV